MFPQVFGYALTVFSFWWAVLGAWTVFNGEVELVPALEASFNVVLIWLIGGVLGAIGGITWVVLERQARKEGLVADKVRGLACSIGPVPMNAKAPGRATTLPSFEGIPDVPPEFFPDWIARYQQTHPAHVGLVKAMLQVYEHTKHLPATHVVGGHGGRTLLQHSLLVSYQMQNLAFKWSYTGLRDRTGKKVLLKLRDGSYEFDPNDPLVLIVGLAHDIGKIEAFIIENGKIVGSHHEHDLTGARMMARMPEMWDIPDADRVALLLAIAHYHHPMELPLSPDRRAIDDRTIAVMELLIKADFVASAIERKGVTPSEQDYTQEMDEREKSDLTDENLWIAFSEILNETGRINSADLNYNVGTICQVAGQNAMRLVLHEPSIRGALMRRLGLMESTQMGDGRHPLTVRLLKLIDEHSLLIKSFKELTYSAESALWSVSFYGKKKTRGTNEAARLTGWPAAIIMLPSISPFVAGLPSYPWTGQVERGTMGEARAKAPGSAAEDAPADADSSAQTETAEQTDQSETTGDSDQAKSAMAIDDGHVEPNGLSSGLTTANMASDSSASNEPDATRPIHAHPSSNPHVQGSTKPHQRKNKTSLDLSVLDKAKALMGAGPTDAQEAAPSTHAAPKQEQGEGAPIFGKQGPLKASAPTAQADESATLGESKGIEVEGPPISQFIVPATAQTAEVTAPSVSPFMLKKSVAKVIRTEAMSITETRGGRKIYVVSRLHLVKHVPEVDWSRASSDIMALCKSSRGAGFETIESGGDLYILIDALMIKEFMERSASSLQ
jgi:hypothetical protein